MSNVEFNPEDRNFYSNLRQRQGPSGPGGLTGWFMRLLRTDSEAKANGVMLVAMLVFFALTLLVLWRFV